MHNTCIVYHTGGIIQMKGQSCSLSTKSKKNIKPQKVEVSMASTNSIIKDIPGYEGLYAITPSGLVFSYRRKRFLKPYCNVSKRWGNHGRPLVKLTDGVNPKAYFVAKLVYITYVGEISKGMDVDHINGNKADNRVENLRLLDRSENMLAFFELQRLTYGSR